MLQKLKIGDFLLLEKLNIVQEITEEYFKSFVDSTDEYGILLDGERLLTKQEIINYKKTGNYELL